MPDWLEELHVMSFAVAAYREKLGGIILLLLDEGGHLERCAFAISDAEIFAEALSNLLDTTLSHRQSDMSEAAISTDPSHDFHRFHQHEPEILQKHFAGFTPDTFRKHR